MAWSPEEKENIATKLKEGLSALQIAAFFPGASRNAIIGVVNRDRMLRDIGFARSPGDNRGRAIAPPRPAPVQEAGAPHVVGQPIGMLRPLRCKFAVNDAAKGETHLFCGMPAEGSYCSFHRGLVYQPRSSLVAQKMAA